MEKAANTYKAKFNKDIFFQTKENVQMLDGSSPQHYFKSLDMIEQWMQQCIDEIRIFIKPICYPLFVYLYFGLVEKHSDNACQFLKDNREKYKAFNDEIDQLALCQYPLDKNNPLVNKYINSKAHIFIPNEIFNFFSFFKY